ncbi:hypothetical protein [Massilia sp. TSP1-1-2]|uniref:hypothetical protein n=1 Tax=unclassified Massilia TaxID=2609279 RepID=UPI003CF3849C
MANLDIRAYLRDKLETWMLTDASDFRPTTAQTTFLRSDAVCETLKALCGHDVRDVIERQLALALAKRR